MSNFRTAQELGICAKLSDLETIHPYALEDALAEHTGQINKTYYQTSKFQIMTTNSPKGYCIMFDEADEAAYICKNYDIAKSLRELFLKEIR